jgi:hypothetical protein
MAARRAALLAAIGFAGLAVFQAALAVGAPWGHAAWGGDSADLSASQQIASGVAAVFYGAATLMVLTRAGIISRERSSSRLIRAGTWFLAVAMALGALPNFASQRRWESLLLGPLAVVLAALCFVVARAER